MLVFVTRTDEEELGILVVGYVLRKYNVYKVGIWIQSKHSANIFSSFWAELLTKNSK